MKIAYASDLHLEFGTEGVLNAALDVEADVLVLAGDIMTERMYEALSNPESSYHTKVKGLFDVFSSKFDKVFIISGNHEYYGGVIVKTDIKIKEILDTEYSNIHYLQDRFFRHGNVLFYGATMWTPMARHSPVIRNIISTKMNDFRKITIIKGGTYRKFRPEDADYLHEVSLLKYKMASQNFIRGDKIVLIQHHGPTSLSIDPIFQNSNINDAYFSREQERRIMNNELGKKPDFIIHGHVHSKMTYSFEGINVVCNPRGYQGGESIADNFKFEYIEL